MEQLLFNLRSLDDSSERELARYRNVGAVEEFRRMKRQERRRIKRIRTAVKALNGALCVLCVILILWMFASWWDVISHNLSPNPVYKPWNIFTLLIR